MARTRKRGRKQAVGNRGEGRWTAGNRGGGGTGSEGGRGISKDRSE